MKLGTPLEDAITKRYATLGFAHTMVGGNPHQFIELYGGKLVEMVAHQPSASTFRDEYYYNTMENQLYKKNNNPPRWVRISDVVMSDDGMKDVGSA
jgi:hypothetical protein